ncbi:MAG: cytochrome c [Anaerolineae bacterium]|nr:cytochrome c [Anaerolineae bacterium]
MIAEPEGDVGHYVATLIFPSPGIWSWSISAFGPEQSLPPLAVLSLTEYGEALFVAKGCAMCHVHRESGVTPVATINRGPDLSRRSFDAAYLREWLRDPSAVDSDAVMPALGLSDDEINALIAFLNG